MRQEFLDLLNKTNKEVILSVGMCTDEEIEKTVSHIKRLKYILCCTSTYPTAPNEVNLNHITTLKNKFPKHRIGFSNHYNGHDACVGATALGADCIEFHVTLNRTMYGSDQAASIENIQTLVKAIRGMSIMKGDGNKQIYENEKPIINKLRKINSWRKTISL